MSKILPILFNTEMIQAILKDRKTTTRRIVKPQPDRIYWYQDGQPAKIRDSEYSVIMPDGQYTTIKPKYKPGDILYVRETWAFMCCLDCENCIFNPVPGDDEVCTHHKTPTTHEDKDSVSEGCYIYRADYPRPGRIIWRPSIHMPKAAARIWLRVTGVWVERIQETTNPIKYPVGKDNTIIREGFKRTCDFIDCWNSTINRADIDKYGWDANPWVWAIEFERCEKPESEVAE